MSEIILETRNLTKNYGSKPALSDLNLTWKKERLLDCWDRTEAERPH